MGVQVLSVIVEQLDDFDRLVGLGTDPGTNGVVQGGESGVPFGGLGLGDGEDTIAIGFPTGGMMDPPGDIGVRVEP